MRFGANKLTGAQISNLTRK